MSFFVLNLSAFVVRISLMRMTYPRCDYISGGCCGLFINSLTLVIPRMLLSLLLIASVASAALLTENRQVQITANQDSFQTPTGLGFVSSAASSAFSPSNSVSVVSAASSSSSGGSTIQTSYLPPAQGDEFGRRLSSLQPGDVIKINGASYTAVRKVAANRIDPVAAHGSTNVRTTPSGYYQPPVAAVNQRQVVDDLTMLSMSIPGTPNVDYPIYAQVPVTSFSCSGRHEGGYFADVDARCQVFHVCALKQKYSFLCPNGTIFDQSTFVCNWWFNVNCPASPGLFGLNDQIGLAPVTPRPVAPSPIVQAQLFETPPTSYLPPPQTLPVVSMPGY